MSIIYSKNSVNLTYHTSDWVINSGVLFHVFVHHNYFTSYTNDDSGYVQMENEGASKIVGIRDICLETSLDYKLLLKDVRYIPNIFLNMISTSMPDDNGYSNQFGKGKWKIAKDSLVLAKRNKVNTLYVIEANVKKENVNVAVKDLDIDTWHQWLGHINEKRLRTTARKGFLPASQLCLLRKKNESSHKGSLVLDKGKKVNILYAI